MKIVSKILNNIDFKPSTTGKEGRYYAGIFGEKGSEGKERVVVAKLEPNISYEKINILGPTHYVVLKGDLIITGTKYSEGTYIRIEAGEIYTPATENGCEVLCIYTKGWEKLS